MVPLTLTPLTHPSHSLPQTHSISLSHSRTPPLHVLFVNLHVVYVHACIDGLMVTVKKSPRFPEQSFHYKVIHPSTYTHSHTLTHTLSWAIVSLQSNLYFYCVCVFPEQYKVSTSTHIHTHSHTLAHTLSAPYKHKHKHTHTHTHTHYTFTNTTQLQAFLSNRLFT